MNNDKIRGSFLYLLGKIQEQIGRLAGSRQQQAKGFEKQICGKAKIAIAEAQKIINNCGKRQYRSV